VVGPLFVGHGTQKLFGWFGGYGPDGTGGYFESLGLRPGKRHATAAGAAEAVGGALLLTGRLTPLASTLVSGTMVTAIRKAHAKNGPWVTNGGYEYNAVLLAAMLAVTEESNGKLAAVAQLAAGVAGSYLATSPALNDPAPAEQEGHADTAGDPATKDAEPRFHRDEEHSSLEPTTAEVAEPGRS
jgi:putative oxidoreductase